MDKQSKAEIIKKYGGNEADTGSTVVQVAIMSAKIKELTEHLKANKKDNHSRRPHRHGEQEEEAPEISQARRFGSVREDHRRIGNQKEINAGRPRLRGRVFLDSIRIEQKGIEGLFLR